MPNKKNKIVTSRYTAMTFFPMNMYHQLSKPSNLFFLFTLILLSIPEISPFSPYAYMFAFCTVIGTSMVKDGVEDYRRHKHDDVINKKQTLVVRKTENRIFTESIFVEDLSAGDFVFVMKNQEVPGDLVFLSSKIDSLCGIRCRSHCFIETSNFDGESNLKKRTSGRRPICDDDSPFFFDRIMQDLCECERYYIENISGFSVNDTGDVLTKFECSLNIGEEAVIYDERNVLLRGSRLKSTEYVFGIVVCVGKCTKLGRSHFKRGASTSLFEKKLCSVIFWIFVIYLVILTLTSVLGANFLTKDDIEYLCLNECLVDEALKQTGTNYIMFSYLVPPSLLVTIEISRFFHSVFVSHDEDMMENGVKSICRNSNITEDIGSVEFILTDKTGTLTKNSMVFKYCHIYDSPNLVSREYLSRFIRFAGSVCNSKDMSKGDWHGAMFIIALLCCNSIEPLNNGFEGVSQDELCILQELKRIGYLLVERDEDRLVLEVCGRKIRIDIILSLDFTSARQRMSVVVKLYDKYFLFSKGSDQKLFFEKDMVFSHGDASSIRDLINKSAKYRSLVVGYKEIREEFLQGMLCLHREVSLRNKAYEQERTFEEVENKMIYLGAIFIEDELQKDVKGTIDSLRTAGIKVWMVTGDKKETALCCARDCGIIKQDLEDLSLIMNGEDFLLKLEEHETLEYESVVIYRATPSQKGRIAYKMAGLGRNTLAVGDGNNDIQMLVNSHIGVGIIGKEGMQASLSADFSIPAFRFIKRLILVHGRYNFMRVSKITINAFFKNIFFISIQFMYNFFNGFSGKPIYCNFFLNYYNVLFTSLIPISIGLFDKDKPEAYLLSHPEEYRDTANFFSMSEFVLGFIYTILTSILVFGLSLGAIYTKDFIGREGFVGGYVFLTNYFSIVVFLVVLFTQIREISFFVVYSWIAIILSVILNFGTFFFAWEVNSQANRTVFTLFSVPVFYLICLFVLSGMMLVDFLIIRLFSVVKKRLIAR